MWVWVDRLGGLVLDASISALVLWAVAALAMLGCRQPARRLRLARAAVIGSLALFPLIGLGLVPRFDLIAVFRGAGLAPHPLLPPRWLAASPPPEVAAPQFMAGAGSVPDGGAPAVVDWPSRVLTLLYLSGVACGLGWLALGCAALVWLTRRSQVPSPEARALYDSLPYSWAWRRPRLLVAGRVRRPALVGTLLPAILIPPELDRPEVRARLRLSLLHELAHAEGSDPWFGLLGNLAQAFWFFVPPLWWAASQVRLDQEYLADRRAAVGFGPLRDYVSSLLDFASTHAGPAGSPAGPGASVDGQGSPLFQRVLMLLRCPFPFEPTPPAWWSRAIPCLALMVTLGVSSLTVRPLPVVPGGPPRVHTFPMARLEIPASPPGLRGRSPLLELPIRLPRYFDLSAEVWGDLPTLARMRLVGLPLEKTRPESPPEPPPSPATWHPVRVRRDADGISLWIDGEKTEPGPADRALTTWLSVEPAPDQPASCQRLNLSW